MVRGFARVEWPGGVPSIVSQDGGFNAAITTAVPGHCVLHLTDVNLAASVSSRAAIGGTVQVPGSARTFSVRLSNGGDVEIAILDTEGAGPSAYVAEPFWVEVVSYFGPSL